MANPPFLYCATDKELFDVLMSSKQQFNENTMLALGRSRGIFLSDNDDRVALADKLSLMVFGSHEIRAIQAEFEKAGRGEKTTSFRLNTELSIGEIKQIADEYKEAVGDEEKVITYGVGSNICAVDLKYTETDFSKTRLRQRQSKEAHLEFKVEKGHTIVTLPATEKARTAAVALSERLYAKKQMNIDLEKVDLSNIDDANLRTAFFTRLISRLPSCKLQNVTRVKVDLASKTDDDLNGEDTEDGSNEEASQQMLCVVRAVALDGQSLLSSSEYQTLHKNGFFITSITWSSKRTESPYQIVEFDAGFDDPALGTGFKYSVRGWATQRDGEYTKSFKPIPPDDKKMFLGLIENTAMEVLREVKAEYVKASQQYQVPGGGA